MTTHDEPANDPFIDDGDGTETDSTGWFDEPEQLLIRRLARWQARRRPSRPAGSRPTTNHHAAPALPALA